MGLVPLGCPGTTIASTAAADYMIACHLFREQRVELARRSLDASQVGVPDSRISSDPGEVPPPAGPPAQAGAGAGPAMAVGQPARGCQEAQPAEGCQEAQPAKGCQEAQPPRGCPEAARDAGQPLPRATLDPRAAEDDLGRAEATVDATHPVMLTDLGRAMDSPQSTPAAVAWVQPAADPHAYDRPAAIMPAGMAGHAYTPPPAQGPAHLNSLPLLIAPTCNLAGLAAQPLAPEADVYGIDRLTKIRRSKRQHISAEPTLSPHPAHHHQLAAPTSDICSNGAPHSANDTGGPCTGPPSWSSHRRRPGGTLLLPRWSSRRRRPVGTALLPRRSNRRRRPGRTALLPRRSNHRRRPGGTALPPHRNNRRRRPGGTPPPPSWNSRRPRPGGTPPPQARKNSPARNRPEPRQPPNPLLARSRRPVPRLFH